MTYDDLKKEYEQLSHEFVAIKCKEMVNFCEDRSKKNIPTEVKKQLLNIEIAARTIVQYYSLYHGIKDV